MRVIVLCGPSGSGKSTLAKQMAKDNPFLVVCEADEYFVRDDGTYQFEGSKLSRAHKWCIKKAEHALSQGRDVVVANTNLTGWERERYRLLAQRFVVPYEERWMPNLPVEVLVKRNIHGLSKEQIERQIAKIER